MDRQYKNDTNAEVIAEFRKRRVTITRLTVATGILVGIVVTMALYGIASKGIALIVLGLSFAYGLIVNLRKWRCPACNGHLGKLYLGLKEPRYCPRCGIRLMEGQ